MEGPKPTQFAAVHVSGLSKSLNTYSKAAVCHVTSSGLDQNDLTVLGIEFHYRAKNCRFMITLSFIGQEALKLEHSRNSTWYVSSGIELFGCLTNKAIIEQIIRAIRGFSNTS